MEIETISFNNFKKNNDIEPSMDSSKTTISFLSKLTMSTVLGSFLPSLTTACSKQYLAYRHPFTSFISSPPPCPLRDYGITLPASTVKYLGVIIIPILEEIFFRGIIQDKILYQLPKYICKYVSPGSEKYLDTIIAKVARIGITAALFGAAHMTNAPIIGEKTAEIQSSMAFIAGIILGIVKESELGMVGSIGLHMGNNYIALEELLYNC